MDLGDGVISPGGIGYDINCGARLLKTNLDAKDIKTKIIEIVNELFHTIPTGMVEKTKTKLNESQLDEILVEGTKWTLRNGYEINNDLEVCEENGNILGADISVVSDMAKRRGITQLGSLGSGNHFLEIHKVDQIYDKNASK